jgi:hypothetical protein
MSDKIDGKFDELVTAIKGKTKETAKQEVVTKQ